MTDNSKTRLFEQNVVTSQQHPPYCESPIVLRKCEHTLDHLCKNINRTERNSQLAQPCCSKTATDRKAGTDMLFFCISRQEHPPPPVHKTTTTKKNVLQHLLQHTDGRRKAIGERLRLVWIAENVHGQQNREALLTYPNTFAPTLSSTQYSTSRMILEPRP